MTPGDTAALAQYVEKQAPHYNLDPQAVLAVADQEGASGAVGDNGSSFGPWQLHKGGAYPSSAPQSATAANAWAWSPAGVDYALASMSKVAGGLRGPSAVTAIVTRFERPSNPGAETAAALADYGHAPSTRSKGKAGASTGGAGGGGGGGGGIFGGVESAISFVFSIRFVEIVGGGLLVLLGLLLLTRQVGLAPPAAGPAAAMEEMVAGGL